jgi:hypothetical protein
MGNTGYGSGRRRLLQTRKVEALRLLHTFRVFHALGSGYRQERANAPGNEIPRNKGVIADFDLSCRVMRLGL